MQDSEDPGLVNTSSIFDDDDDDDFYVEEEQQEQTLTDASLVERQISGENNAKLSSESLKSSAAQSVHSDEQLAQSEPEDEEDKDYEIDENEENDDFVLHNLPEKTKLKRRHKRKKTDSTTSNVAKYFKRNKHSSSARNFIDVEAVVGDDDDYDESLADEEMEFMKEITESQQPDSDLVHHRRFQYSLSSSSPKGGMGHLASAIGDLERRFQDYDKETIDEEYDDEPITPYFKKADDPTRFIPDALDAKLWMVATNKGVTEREVVISIMSKAEHMRLKNIRFPILSVFAADGIKGRIYVEAESPAKIVDALAGLRSVNTTRITMVPFKEIGTIYTMGNRAPKVVRYGDLIRFRGGLYSGDLGQVTDSDEHTGFAWVRVIPRVNLEDLLSQQRGGRNETITKERPSQETRPLARLITREEIEMKGGIIEIGTGKGSFRLGTHLFEDTGYLLRKVRTRALTTGDEVVPTVSELKEFSKTLSGIQETESSTSLVPSWKSLLTDRLLTVSGTANYQVGDMVILQAGDLAGLKGHVTAIEGKTLYIIPEGLKDRIAVSGVEAIKYFEIGDSVKVCSGTHQGKSGLVTALDLEKGTATIFWPELNKPIHCSLYSLQKCANSCLGTEGMSALGGFSVNDLVQLTGEQTGVIVRIDAGQTFSVLTTENQLVTVPLSGLAAKRPHEFVYALDSKKNQISLKAIVTLRDPVFKRATGRVMHIWKNYIFVKLLNKDIAPTGYKVCRGHDLTVSITDQRSYGMKQGGVAGAPLPDAASHPQFDNDSPSYSQNKVYSGDNGRYRSSIGNDKEFQRGSGGRNQFYGSRNRFNGCRLKIIGTRDKGKYGTAIHFDGDKVRIQLEGGVKTAYVSKSDVIILDKPYSKGGNSGFSKHSSTNATPNSTHLWDNYFDSIRKEKEKEITTSNTEGPHWWKVQSPKH